MSLLSEKQIAAWKNGTWVGAHHQLGAHRSDSDTTFRVWAPNAKAVDVVGDFDNWQPRAHPMQKDNASGIWEKEVADAVPGQCYKFFITPQKGDAFLKADPFGFYHEEGSHHASVIYSWPNYEWQDDEWLNRRADLQQPDRPLSIYEVHPGSWKRKATGSVLSYTELADELIPYVQKMGFTHIELMPVMEHPYNPSWGYQITGYFAPSSQYGTPAGFMAFVDACHRQGIGVILDWVPGHFPRDPHGLATFDGTSLYEHKDKRRREHPDWGTHNFDLDKPEVRSFLLSNAFFWCEKYHVDGFRVDAVASMLYLDYSRHEEEWLPNTFGGKENLGAVAFLQDLNMLLGQEYPGVLTMAEESTSWPGITKEVAVGGLGFDYKWNMGWMNDTLRYFSLPPESRPGEEHAVTFPLTFAFNEQFILPLSHDEVVHLKKSLWSKMPGKPAQKFRQLKMLFLFMMGYPGKKLLFMGSELAEKQEWSEDGALHWALLEKEEHAGLHTFVRDLLHFYHSEAALYETDCEPAGFVWNALPEKDGVFSFSRKHPGTDRELVFIFNLSSDYFREYEISALRPGVYTLLFDTETSGRSSEGYEQVHAPFTLKPLQALLLRREGTV